MLGAVLNDLYRLDAELGRGGMGVVCQARDLPLDRDVAAKVLSAGLPGAEGRAAWVVAEDPVLMERIRMSREKGERPWP